MEVFPGTCCWHSALSKGKESADGPNNFAGKPTNYLHQANLKLVNELMSIRFGPWVRLPFRWA